MNTNELTDELSREIKYTREQIQDFGEKLQEDPAHALEWGASCFNHAARLLVAADALSGLMSGCSIADIRTEAEKMVLRGAVDPPSSTSPTSNLMELEKTRAWGRLLTMLRADDTPLGVTIKCSPAKAEDAPEDPYELSPPLANRFAITKP